VNKAKSKATSVHNAEEADITGMISHPSMVAGLGKAKRNLISDSLNKMITDVSQSVIVNNNIGWDHA
jgi:hypothetical protein